MPAETKDHPGVIAFPPLILACHAAIGGLLHWGWPIALLSPLPARLLGALIALAAGAQALWARQVMLKAGTNILPNKPTLAIVAAGPYTYTRNPMYLSLCLVQLGVALLINGLLPLLCLVPLVLVLHFGVILREERYLAAKFGEAYLTYQRGVRRWL